MTEGLVGPPVTIVGVADCGRSFLVFIAQQTGPIRGKETWPQTRRLRISGFGCLEVRGEMG